MKKPTARVNKTTSLFFNVTPPEQVIRIPGLYIPLGAYYTPNGEGNLSQGDGNFNTELTENSAWLSRNQTQLQRLNSLRKKAPTAVIPIPLGGIGTTDQGVFPR
jgi:hypothetical protein